MKTRRLLAALAAAAMSATLLTGCGGDKPAAQGFASGADPCAVCRADFAAAPKFGTKEPPARNRGSV